MNSLETFHMIVVRVLPFAFLGIGLVIGWVLPVLDSKLHTFLMEQNSTIHPAHKSVLFWAGLGLMSILLATSSTNVVGLAVVFGIQMRLLAGSLPLLKRADQLKQVWFWDLAPSTPLSSYRLVVYGLTIVSVYTGIQLLVRVFR